MSHILTCWWIENYWLRNLRMPHWPNYSSTLSNCRSGLHLSQEMLCEPTGLWMTCFTSASMRSFVLTGSTLFKRKSVHCSGWKSSLKQFSVLFCKSVFHSHSWRTRGRRCTKQWWHCSSSRLGRRPLWNHNQFHQGPDAPGQNDWMEVLICHLVPSPGSSNPQLLSKGELKEEQGHPHHQQHHQERDDERSWEKGIVNNSWWEMIIDMSSRMSLLEVMMSDVMMNGTKTQMRVT